LTAIFRAVTVIIRGSYTNFMSLPPAPPLPVGISSTIMSTSNGTPAVTSRQALTGPRVPGAQEGVLQAALVFPAVSVSIA
jgi:hypothetical protein